MTPNTRNKSPEINQGIPAMRGKSYKGVVFFFAALLLLLSAIQNCARACPPHCPPCYYWNGQHCIYGCNPDRCETCKQGECQSTCDSENCQRCNGSGSCESTCDPNQCEQCDGEGNCESSCDPNQCEVCDGQGNCESTCDPDQCEECDGQGNCVSTCNPDQCCDNGTCVDKCTNTGQCDYGELPSGPYPNCELLADPQTGRCGIIENAICGHVFTIAQSDAECADCEPGCDKERISACIEITEYRCTEHIYGVWFICLCDPKESYTSGNHYECAD